MEQLYRMDLERLIKVKPSDFNRVSREIAMLYKMNVNEVRRDAFALVLKAPQQPA